MMKANIIFNLKYDRFYILDFLTMFTQSDTDNVTQLQTKFLAKYPDQITAINHLDAVKGSLLFRRRNNSKCLLKVVGHMLIEQTYSAEVIRSCVPAFTYDSFLYDEITKHKLDYSIDDYWLRRKYISVNLQAMFYRMRYIKLLEHEFYEKLLELQKA
jgi:hypothetical protein